MRYTYDQTLQNIRAKVEERYGSRRGRRHKVLYLTLGIDKTEWSRKWKGYPRFTDAEIGAIAEHFDAPPGWPFISWETADANNRAMKLLEKLAPPAQTAAAPPGPAPAAPDKGRPARRRRKAQ